MSKKYISNTQFFEVERFVGDNGTDLVQWGNCGFTTTEDERYLTVKTPNGSQKADIGDYLVKDKNGNISVVKSHLFNDYYLKYDIKKTRELINLPYYRNKVSGEKCWAVQIGKLKYEWVSDSYVNNNQYHRSFYVSLKEYKRGLHSSRNLSHELYSKYNIKVGGYIVYGLDFIRKTSSYSNNKMYSESYIDEIEFENDYELINDTLLKTDPFPVDDYSYFIEGKLITEKSVIEYSKFLQEGDTYIEDKRKVLMDFQKWVNNCGGKSDAAVRVYDVNLYLDTLKDKQL